MKTMTDQHTEDFCHFFKHLLSVLLSVWLDCFLGVSYNFWLPEKRLELRMGCMVWNEEKVLEKAIFLKKEGIGLETKKDSIWIDILPAIGPPSIAHCLQYMPEKTSDRQSISPPIKNWVNTTIRIGKPTNYCSPIMKSPAVLYIFQFQESPSSPIKLRFCYQK